jgi:hypothetical protein
MLGAIRNERAQTDSFQAKAVSFPPQLREMLINAPGFGPSKTDKFTSTIRTWTLGATDFEYINKIGFLSPDERASRRSGVYDFLLLGFAFYKREPGARSRRGKAGRLT